MTNEDEASILGAITRLAQDVGKVIGKQSAIHTDLTEFKEETHDSIEEVNIHLKTSNGRLSEVEHEQMTWKTRFITSFAIIALASPFIVEQSRTFIISIVT